MPEHLARIAYTSGTTGKPKGVAYTVERLLARLNNHFLAMEYGLSVDDAMLHVGPLTHAAGVYLFPCFLRGARNVVLDRFDAASLLAAIGQHRVSHLMLVPTMMNRLVEALEPARTADLSSLRRIHYGTAPTPVSLIRRAIAVFGPILRQQYGMTEAVQPLTVLYPHEHLGDSEDGADDPIGSCGTAHLPTCASRCATPTAARWRPARWARSRWRTKASPRWSSGAGRSCLAEAVRDGWYYTGDLGRLDRAGLPAHRRAATRT